jgi:hypothetical protein
MHAVVQQQGLDAIVALEQRRLATVGVDGNTLDVFAAVRAAVVELRVGLRWIGALLREA